MLMRIINKCTKCNITKCMHCNSMIQALQNVCNYAQRLKESVKFIWSPKSLCGSYSNITGDGLDFHLDERKRMPCSIKTY